MYRPRGPAAKAVAIWHQKRRTRISFLLFLFFGLSGSHGRGGRGGESGASYGRAIAKIVCLLLSENGDTLVQYAACLPGFFERRARWHNSIPITLVGRVLQFFLLAGVWTFPSLPPPLSFRSEPVGSRILLMRRCNIWQESTMGSWRASWQASWSGTYVIEGPGHTFVYGQAC